LGALQEAGATHHLRLDVRIIKRKGNAKLPRLQLQWQEFGETFEGRSFGGYLKANFFPSKNTLLEDAKPQSRSRRQLSYQSWRPDALGFARPHPDRGAPLLSRCTSGFVYHACKGSTAPQRRPFKSFTLLPPELVPA